MTDAVQLHVCPLHPETYASEASHTLYCMRLLTDPYVLLLERLLHICSLLLLLAPTGVSVSCVCSDEAAAVQIVCIPVFIQDGMFSSVYVEMS